MPFVIQPTVGSYIFIGTNCYYQDILLTKLAIFWIKSRYNNKDRLYIYPREIVLWQLFLKHMQIC